MTKHQRVPSDMGHSQIEYSTLNINFEKWNLMMRKELSYPLFKEMDLLLGYENLISRTHDFFSSSMIYLADEELEMSFNDQAEVMENKHVWFNHLGGFEGQRQKGWTILTVCLIELSKMPYKVQHQLIGQGDNQVLLIKNRIPYKTINGESVPDYYTARVSYDALKKLFFETVFFRIFHTLT